MAEKVGQPGGRKHRQWHVAIFISLFLHSTLLVGVPAFLSQKKKSISTERSREIVLSPKDMQAIIQQIHPLPLASRAHRAQDPLPYVENIMEALLPSDPAAPLKKPQLFPDHIKDVLFAPLAPVEPEAALAKNPAYMDYYRFIREKIRANAYRNYTRSKSGEVLVTFRLLNDGTLKEVNLDSSSTPEKYLNDIAVKSVFESAPFPVFPAELKTYPQLRFTISIYFKNN